MPSSGAGPDVRLVSPRLRSLHPPVLALAALGAVLLASGGLAAPPRSPRSAPGIVVDGSERHQAMEGFGVKFDPRRWNGAELAPAVDRLLDDLGVTLFGVSVDLRDWDVANAGDPAGVRAEAPWSALEYLNQKGVTSGIVLSLEGLLPARMGGKRLDRAAESEWVELVASLVRHARVSRRLQFGALSPLEAPDAVGRRGPLVDGVQTERVLRRLARRLQADDLADVRLVGPWTVSTRSAAERPLPRLLSDGLHAFWLSADTGLGPLPAFAGPLRLWVSGRSPGAAPLDAVAALLRQLSNDAVTAAFVDGAGEGPAPAAVAAYAPLFRFVGPGAVRIGATSGASLPLVAFLDPVRRRLTILGRNSSDEPLSLTGRLTGLPVPARLEWYESDPLSAEAERGSDVAVDAGGRFTLAVSGGALFTLTGQPDEPTTAPAPPARKARPASGSTSRPAPVRPVATAAAAGLVAAYGFEEGAGASTADASGLGNTGTISAASWVTTGKFGKALSFNGTSSLVSVNDAAALRLTAAMTLEAWVRPTASAAWRCALLKETAAGLAYGLYASDASSHPGGFVHIASDVDATSPSTIALNAWSHLATTYDGATLRLFVNGAQVTSRALSGSILSSSSPLRIGGNKIWGEYFAGTLDEVRVYNRALSPAEIQADMNTPVNGTGDVVPPTVGLFAPAAGSTVSGTVSVSATAADDVGVAGVQFLLDGVALGAELTATPYTLNWNTTVVANGVHALSARARDGAGNQSTSTPVSVTVQNVDAVPPTVSLTAPVAGTTLSGTLSVSATAADDVAVAGVQFLLDGSALGAEDAAAPYSVSWDTTTAAVGAHVLSARARDAAGNQTTSAGVGVTVQRPDTVAPVVAITAPAAGSTVSGTVTVSAAASDDVGVAGVQFLLDGVALGAEDTTAPWAVSWNTASGAGTVTAAAVTAASANLTVDAGQAFQTMAGMGTSINVNSWNGGQLKPALDYLVDVNGCSLLRVVRDPIDWVGSESDIPLLHALDPATLARVYETPKMQDIWNTMAYLNQKGLTGDRLVLNFMGWTPAWLGGSGGYGGTSTITPGKEPAFATMVASLVYYGRRVKGLSFGLVAPMNEPNWDAKEGPRVDGVQYTTVLRAIATELDAMGLPEIRLVGPDTSNGTSGYDAPMMADATVAGRVDHLSFHTYANSTWPGTGYPGKDYWLTETAQWCSSCDQNGTPSQGEWAFSRDTGDFFLQDLVNGFATVLVWEGYDSFYYHHDSYSTWGLLGYDTGSGVYTPRKRFYTNAQLTAFIRPGARRVLLSTGVTGLTALAFYDAARGQISIVGHNAGSSPAAISGLFKNLPATVTALALYETDSGSQNLQRAPDVAVAGQAFSVSIPADTFFSLRSTAPGGDGPHTLSARARDAAGNVTTSQPVSVTVQNADPTPPVVALTAPDADSTLTGSVVLSATASDNVAVAGVQFLLDGAPLGAELTTAPYSASWDTTSATNGAHALAARARDAAGNRTTSAPLSVTVQNADTAAPTVSVAAPAAGSMVAGTVTLSASATDNVGVAGVQFLLDGAPLGAEDTTSPYSVAWNTTTASEGAHTLAARARDTTGNAGVSAAVSVVVANVASTALVAAYGFEEGSGTTVADASGRGNAGTLSGATWVTTGKFGKALSFNGTSSLLTVASAASLDLAAGLTLEAWVRPASNSGNRAVLVKERSTGLAYALYARSASASRPNGTVRIASTNRTVTGTSALTLNAWSHLALTYNGATLALYVNGVLVATQARTGAVTTSTNPLRIGGSTVASEYFSGLIDEVRLYSRALSQAEIQADEISAVRP